MVTGGELASVPMRSHQWKKVKWKKVKKERDVSPGAGAVAAAAEEPR